MELEGITLSEISLRQILYDLTYMWNLKKKIKNLHRNRLVVPRGEGGMGEAGQSIQTSSYKMSKFWGSNGPQKTA